MMRLCSHRCMACSIDWSTCSTLSMDVAGAFERQRPDVRMPSLVRSDTTVRTLEPSSDAPAVVGVVVLWVSDESLVR